MPILYGRTGSSPVSGTDKPLALQGVFRYLHTRKATNAVHHAGHRRRPARRSVCEPHRNAVAQSLGTSQGLCSSPSPPRLSTARWPLTANRCHCWSRNLGWEGMKDTFDFIDGRWGADIPVYVASPEQLKRLTGYRLHRGALCAMPTRPCALRSRGLQERPAAWQ